MKVLFFGQLREMLQTTSLEFTGEVTTVLELRQVLQGKAPLWRESLAAELTLVAVNQTLASDTTQLNEGDEVAFFPPVTGG